MISCLSHYSCPEREQSKVINAPQDGDKSSSNGADHQAADITLGWDGAEMGMGMDVDVDVGAEASSSREVPVSILNSASIYKTEIGQASG
jgi:hypothetical protein